MKPTDTLRHEHEIVLLILKAAEREARSIRETGAVHADQVAEMVDFFKNFVDRCHHGKEEKHLFPAMRERGLPAGGGPIAVMLLEHEQGRAATAAISRALERVKGGDAEASGELADALLAYADLLGSHIAKENNVLFHMADQMLPLEEQEELAAAFDRVEAEEMGEGTHERYHQLAHRLSRG